MTGPAYVIEVIEGADAGRKLELGAPLEIGREPGLALVLDDEQASRRHALITLDGAVAVVEDLGSLNGTFVNDQPVERPRRLVSGDRVLIGTTVVELRDARDVARQPSAVLAVPHVTEVEAHVLNPGQAGEFPPAPEPEPALRTTESVPGYVPAKSSPADLPVPAPSANYEAVAALVDGRVKHRTSVAAFGFLSLAALAVIVYFGAT